MYTFDIFIALWAIGVHHVLQKPFYLIDLGSPNLHIKFKDSPVINFKQEKQDGHQRHFLFLYAISPYPLSLAVL